MRRAWCIIGLLLLTGCAGDSDVARVASLLYNSVTAAPMKVARERAAEIPYASVGIQLGSSDQVLFVLGETVAGELHWFAGEQSSVATRSGRVVRTVGLPYDLGGFRASPANAADSAPASAAAQNEFLMDFPDLGVFGANARCASRVIGDEEIEILGARILTHHVAERCTVQALRWNFENDFWYDRATGYVWRSRQYIHPKSRPLTLEILRPEQQTPA
jgi:hypothetical protein